MGGDADVRSFTGRPSGCASTEWDGPGVESDAVFARGRHRATEGAAVPTRGGP